MDHLTPLNAVANALIAMSMFVLVMRIWNNPLSKIKLHPIHAFIRKAGMCATICGSIVNILTCSTPNATEIWLNIAVAANFISIAMLFPKTTSVDILNK